MANIIIPNEERRKETEYIAKTFGVDSKDPAMREAAEISAARTKEAVEMQNKTRRYY